MTDLTQPAETPTHLAATEPRADGCALHATVPRHAQALRDTEPDSTQPHGAQAEPRQAEARDSPADLAQTSADLHAARQRCAELEADLAAQRVYSGRALADAWTVIYRLRNERADVERWQADKQKLLEYWEAEKQKTLANCEADKQALLGGWEAEKHELLQAWQSDKQILEQSIAAFTTSTSWRITAPMRTVGRGVRTILTMLRRGSFRK
jgi:hypothetical protein